jgi:hypothetical protein
MGEIMSQKKDMKYTTIQIRKEIHDIIRQVCKQNSWIASAKTEQYWIGLFSASMSGSSTL